MNNAQNITTMTIIIQNRLAMILPKDKPRNNTTFFKQWLPSFKREHKEPTILIRV